MDNSDKQHLTAIRHQINAYHGGRIDLDALIRSVESLLEFTQALPEAWVTEFRRNWGVLEEVYSVSVVRDQSLETSENRKLITSGLSRLREMLDEVLSPK